MSNIVIAEPIEVKAARALGPNGGWMITGDFSYDELTWDKDEAGVAKPTEAEWNAKIKELSGGQERDQTNTSCYDAGW